MNLLWGSQPSDGNTADPHQGWTEILGRVERLPGVVSAASAALHPMERGFFVDLDIPGMEGLPDGRAPSTMFFPISPRYPETVGIPLLRGRRFDERDHAEAPGVALVNEEFVRRYLGEGDPIGRRVRKRRVGGPWGPAEQVEIVGVVGDVKSQGLNAEAEPIMFVPQAQTAFGYLRLFVRSAEDPRTLIPALREIVWSVDPRIPLPEFALLEDAVRSSIAAELSLARLGGAFSLLGVLLEMGGVYGIVSFALSRRTREIGIRRALGAHHGAVAGMVARWSLGRIGAGVALGLLGAFGLDRLLRGFLFGVTSGDPRVLGVVTVALLVAGIIATAVPLRRALAVDPLVAVRAE